MNILMMTNTYTPLVGGLERSIQHFTLEYRKRGHRVVIVAPEYEGSPEHEEDVIRVPSISHINGSDFSLQLPVPGVLTEALKGFEPDIIHAHHPFLIGNTAVRLAYSHHVPLVFTHHTLFEEYTHLLPIDTPAMKRFVIELATGYANLCDQVFAPSESVALLLRKRGVKTPISIVPTGIEIPERTKVNKASLRQKFGLPLDALVLGHVGRLSPEKNLKFLSKVLARFAKQNAKAHVLLVGAGPSKVEFEDLFLRNNLSARLHCPGVLKDQDLLDAYQAMDAFVFSSKSETQGLVVAEAMANSLPVIALDAPGVREVVQDKINGRLLASATIGAFLDALTEFSQMSPANREQMARAAHKTALGFSMEKCAYRALSLYTRLLKKPANRLNLEQSKWATALGWIQGEWGAVKTLAVATGKAMATAATVNNGAETPEMTKLSS